jgi:Zn-dependent M28 family amino/carboxypeptidase
VQTAIIKTIIFTFPSLVLLGACTEETIDHTGFVAAAEIVADVDGNNVWNYVGKIAASHPNDVKVDNTGYTSSELFPSAELSRDSATRLVIHELQELGYDADTLVMSGEGTLKAYNIVAEWPGTTKANEVVLIGVHHDAFFTGADDNSSAVAAMLETARVISRHRFARTIRFVSFDLEEFGSIGSTRYMEEGFAHDVVSAIVMDMIGYSSEEPGSQKSVMGVKVPDVGNYLFVIGNERSAEMTQRMVALSNSQNLAKVHGIIAPGDGVYFLSSVFMRSDHGLMWFKSIPAVFLTDGANFRNPHYHKASDTPETLNPDFLANNTRLLTASVALFAEKNP